MTATSVLAPAAVTRSWNAVQRAAVMVFVLAVFIAVAFTAGRVTAPDHHAVPVIAPTGSVSSPSVTNDYPCRAGHPC
jgi:hypothetical protein